MAKRQPDLRKLAQRQRWMIWLLLVNILSYCLLSAWVRLGQSGLSSIAIAALVLVSMAVSALMVAGVVLVMTAMGAHPVWMVLFGVLMVAPCVNLIVLAVVDVFATIILKRAGIRVGLFGANLEDAERVLNPLLCQSCGYNLTGNVSGMCPECGRRIEQVVPQPPGEQTATT